ncbi:hypothetical protein FTUN_5962 [Frigoriglobus tundricola]|uniref:Uncharacterized protein n=1 Tax=Frigoriglobus tundricola TaxID=2774151 RepID=A0A6M5YZM0_9BACT|nr:hypothetical protein FTUN_5962 [Frigoriglobus tundricola]
MNLRPLGPEPIKRKPAPFLRCDETPTNPGVWINLVVERIPLWRFRFARFDHICSE